MPPKPSVSLTRRSGPGLGIVLVLAALVGLLMSLLSSHERTDLNKPHYRDVNGDRRADLMWTYVNGRRDHLFKDRNFDGRWDEWIDYDAAGNVTQCRYDENFDGKPDLFITYANDVAVSGERDTDFNGVPDWFETYQYGVLQQAELRPNRAPFATQHNSFSNGVLAEVKSGGDASGNFQNVTRYDPFLNPLGTNQPGSNHFDMLLPRPAR